MSRPHHAPRRPSSLPQPGRAAFVALGGAAGALARTGLGDLLPAADGTWPWAVVVVNLAGAGLLGLLLGAFARGAIRRWWLLPLLGTGVLGAVTTFSTLALGIERMLALGRPGLALGYAAASLAGGLLAAAAGIALGRGLAARRHGAA